MADTKIEKHIKIEIRVPRPFKRIGFKPQYKTLFDEWKVTARRGLPSRWTHPIKRYYWRRWNFMTHFGRGTSTSWVGLNYLGSSKDIRPGGVGYGLHGLGADRKPATVKSLKKLDDRTYDSLMFV